MQPSSLPCGWRAWLSQHPWRRLAGPALWLLLGLSPLGPALAQAAEDADPPGLDEPELAGARLSPEEAARLLALPLPADADGNYALLQSQLRAAQLLEDRPRQIELARQLTVAGRGRPGGEVWVRLYLSAEFNWGSSGRALQASEPFVTDTGLGLGTRATAALRQTYFASQGPDRAVLSRLWTRADALAAQAQAQGVAPRHLTIDRLQVRSEIERRDGDLGAAVATLRQAVGLGRRWLDEARQSARGNPQNPALLDAQAWLDGSQGMLVYALVRQGRAAEAIEVAQSNIALWRAGQLSDGLGARWNYRLATGLVATQQYEAGLAAARLAEEMLQRSGAAATSHTRWLARLELVRSLIGLRRWQEADESYRALVGEMDGDSLARSRASDSRLTALLAAKNGRLGEALETAERSHRYRLRLYGKAHPLTQEAAGVRAVVRLLRGDTGGAMSDYEELFAATLDNPGGWLDLDLRGLRGFVLGIAFGEFMNHVAERALRGEGVEPALAARALQIADRSKLGATQRALTDSTARVLAATPALRGLLDQEQAQRQLASGLFGTLATSLGQEDRLRRELASEAFKALSPAERKPRQEELWDIAADQVYFSARWRALMGTEAEQAVPGMAAWTQPLDGAARQAFTAALDEHLAGRSQQFHHVLQFRQGGVDRWLLARGMATREAGRAARMAGSLTDISEQQLLQRQITFDALHDRLTGLPNRTLFLERLGQLYEADSGMAGVVLVDIDGFRAFNEAEGAPAADAVLITLSRRLGAHEGQALTVARLEADRFALLFNAPLLPDGSTRLAEWALGQFHAPFDMGLGQRQPGANIGWAHASQGPASAEELLNAAELALSHAKLHQRGRAHAFDPAEQLLENSRRWLKESIDLALQRGEFRLFYQPLVRLKDRQLLGFEALIRWPHPSKGMVMPGDFIPFAEASGQIVPMGRWILLEAAEQLRRWDALGFDGEIAVNLSSAQFSAGDLEADARAVLAVLGTVSPQRIKLEVTESMAMANPQLTTLALQSLATMGFKISIDDFGTGYSSLAYLHRFPFDTLKIDRSFVMRLAAGREAVEIVRTIVGLALALNKQVLAEGVEEESQAALLQQLGVHVGQGWLFAKALPAEQAEALIRQTPPSPIA